VLPHLLPSVTGCFNTDDVFLQHGFPSAPTTALLMASWTSWNPHAVAHAVHIASDKQPPASPRGTSCHIKPKENDLEHIWQEILITMNVHIHYLICFTLPSCDIPRPGTSYACSAQKHALSEAGRISNVNRTRCVACPSGKAGQTRCTPCEKGKVATSSGLVSCAACEVQ